MEGEVAFKILNSDGKYVPELLNSDGKYMPDILLPGYATILDLKMHIKLFMDFDTSSQTLTFDDQELTNDKTISNYDFGKSPNIVLDIADDAPGETKFHTSVKFGTEKTIMGVKDTYLVADLKAKVARFWDIPILDTTLHHSSKKMEDHVPLFDYDIYDASEIEVKVSTTAG